MSYHRISYRVFPDDETDRSHDDWLSADIWINGCAYESDLKSALALAKLGSVNCRFPFVVQAVPIGSVRPKYCDIWIINP